MKVDLQDVVDRIEEYPEVLIAARTILLTEVVNEIEKEQRWQVEESIRQTGNKTRVSRSTMHRYTTRRLGVLADCFEALWGSDRG